MSVFMTATREPMQKNLCQNPSELASVTSQNTEWVE